VAHVVTALDSKHAEIRSLIVCESFNPHSNPAPQDIEMLEARRRRAVQVAWLIQSVKKGKELWSF
jgi:hypothetical protein